MNNQNLIDKQHNLFLRYRKQQIAKSKISAIKTQTCKQVQFYFIFNSKQLDLILKISIKQMVIFNPTRMIKKSQFSSELGHILEYSCKACYRQFDQEKLAPYQVYPCQHTYCAQCVNNQLFTKNEQTDKCPECSLKIEKRTMKKSKMILNMLRIIRANCKVQETPDDPQKINRQVARQLLSEDDNYFYSCPRCEQPYNRDLKLPNIVCQNQHLLCSECIRKSGRYSSCQRCGQDYLQDIFTNNMIINTSQFIHKKLFCETINIVVNEKQFTIVTYSQTTVKDIFHILQEFDHISNRLEIKLCKFYADKIMNQIEKRDEIQFTENIGSGKIKKIYLQFSQDALSLGGNVTKSSKFLKELPIKINNFEQLRRPNLTKIQQEEQQSIFGEQVQAQRSKFFEQMKKKQSQQRSQKSMFIKGVIPFQQQQEINQEKKQRSQLSESKFNLLVKSRELERKNSISRSFKQSKIKRSNLAPQGSKINPKVIQNINSRLNHEDRAKILPLFLQKHQVEEVNEAYLCYEVHKIMNQPFTKQLLAVSQQMQKSIIQKAKQGDLLSLILYIQKKDLEDGQIKVIFNPKSTIRSKLTLKTLTSHMLTNRFMVTESIDQNQEFFFERMNQNQSVIDQFIQKNTKKYAQKFGLSKEDLVIHSLTKGKGSNILTFSTSQGDLLCKYLKNNLDKDIQIHPYFTQLELSPEDFDNRGYIKFKQQKNDIEFRGNWPYYQPIRSVRHGVKVKGMFDNGDDTWLKMNNVKGQWAVGFHGVRNPNQAYKQYKNVILSILSGLHQPDKSMLIVVQNSRQAYSSQECINKPGQQVGHGVYLSPMMAETLPYTQPQIVGDKSYHLVFQCRLKPNEIRIPRSKHNYWIVRHPAAIRPYGIVLIQNKDRINYPSSIKQFGQNFNYEKYRTKIESSM